MAEFNYCMADGAVTLDGHVDAACFTFSRGCHCVIDGVAHYVNWYVCSLVGYFFGLLSNTNQASAQLKDLGRTR